MASTAELAPCSSLDLAIRLLIDEPNEAILRLQQISARGCHQATYKLATLYSTRGSKLYDLPYSIELFTRAAEKGHALAQANLGFRYFSGAGVGKDKVLGCALIDLSARQGVSRSKKILKLLLKKMSDEEIQGCGAIDAISKLSLTDNVRVESTGKPSVKTKPQSPGLIASIYADAIPYIYTMYAGESGEDYYSSQGTGFLLSGGLLVTNEHVIESNDVILGIDEDEKEIIFDPIYSSKEHDMAILRPKRAIGGGLKLSTKKMLVGSEIVVIGAPDEHSGTITEGIISSYRNMNGLDYMQISAGVHKGSSGGPVLGMDGLVYGLVTFKHKEVATIAYALTSYELFRQIKRERASIR